MGNKATKNERTSWLGSIPESWSLTTISSMYDLRNEKVSDKDYPPLSVTMKGIVPQLESAAKTDNGDNRKLVRKGDFAINSRSDRRGSCGISQYDGSVSLINTVLKPKGKMHPGYYNWLFHTVAFADEFYKCGHGIVDDLWTTRWQEMKQIIIPVPPQSIQSAIAAYLDDQCAKIDTLIAEVKESIEEYKKWKASLIFETVTKGLDTNVEMKDSGVKWVEKIPAHWNVARLKALFSFGKGLSITKADLVEDGIPVVSYGQIHAKTNNGTHLSDELLRHVPSKYLKSNPDCLIQYGDIVFADTSEDLTGLGNAVLMDRTEPVFAGYHTIISHPTDEKNSKYISYLLRTDCWRFQLRSNASGIKVFSVTQKMLRTCNLILPPAAEQKEITNYLDEKCFMIDKLIDEKTAVIENLAKYKQSLIYEVVTGKRKVV